MIKYLSALTILAFTLNLAPCIPAHCIELNSSVKTDDTTTVKSLLMSKKNLDNKNLPFLSHTGNDRFDTSLAMNLYYAPVLSLRSQLERALGKKLDFYKAWNKNGEAHITVITPLEYYDVLKKYISIEEIEKIAIKNNIQQSDLEVLGLGRGEKELEGKLEETYFLIFRSDNLLKIRHEVYKEFLKNGGALKDFDPEDFFPHVTVGYTKRDLHITDGIYKDIRSLDKRFSLVLL